MQSQSLDCLLYTSMKGAINLDLDKIESNRIISLDNGKEGKILVSSAAVSYTHLDVYKRQLGC